MPIGGSQGRNGGIGGSVPRVSSRTKLTSGIHPTQIRGTESVAKRRLGTQGKAAGAVRAKANKEIKAERKVSGDYLYDKATYGRKSVNPAQPKAKVKPSSGGMTKGQNAAGARYTAQAKKSSKKK